MKIKTVKFIKSSKNSKDAPVEHIPEYAFIGRSNVGKSSLINMIVSRKNIAKTSSTPGKTQLINHYLINNSYFISDLPGYGYTKISKLHRKKFQRLISEYILNRKQIIRLFLLIDARHFPLKIDLNFIKFIYENKILFSVVFTKYDKVKFYDFKEVLSCYKTFFLNFFGISPVIFITSSKNNIGYNEIINYISNIII